MHFTACRWHTCSIQPKASLLRTGERFLTNKTTASPLRCHPESPGYTYLTYRSAVGHPPKQPWKLCTGHASASPEAWKLCFAVGQTHLANGNIISKKKLSGCLNHLAWKPGSIGWLEKHWEADDSQRRRTLASFFQNWLMGQPLVALTPKQHYRLNCHRLPRICTLPSILMELIVSNPRSRSKTYMPFSKMLIVPVHLP